MITKCLNWLTVAAMLSLTACMPQTIEQRPDLKRLYEISSADRFQPPVIIIHGVLGSRLRTRAGHQEIWPGSVTQLLFGSFDNLRLEIQTDTLEADFSGSEPYALFEAIGDNDYYGRIIDTLTEAGGYRLAQPGDANPQHEARVYTFIYDWRQDLTQNAAELDRFIEQLRRDYGMPGLKVDIVAHSMGALITRYYLRYGSHDVLNDATFRFNSAAAQKVRKVVLIGAPNLGSVSGLQQFLMGFQVGTGGIPTETLATMPGVYQLLPHPDRDWMITPDGNKDQRDLYDPRTWRSFGWSIFNPEARQRILTRFNNDTEGEAYLATLERYFDKQLYRARQFHRAISTPIQQSPVRYIVFGGDCELTPARCLIERVDNQVVIRLHPENIKNRVAGVDYEKLMLEPGDGRVTKPSLLARNSLDPSVPGRGDEVFPLAYSMFLCEEHSQLTGNINFQDNLLNVLL
ncbi:MAG: alpha/beta fold hydrolase, partial [Mariprofundaceae bacterium]|nr:alpha/beta fold hydrolase [Mariprofundaceae bacterium]